MRLDCLVVSHDPEVLKTVSDVFVGMDLNFREHAASALETIVGNHFDAFIIDVDGVEYSSHVMAGIRGSRANWQSVVFTLVNGTTTISAATELGANFVLGKPVDKNRFTTYLQASIHKMEADHRRYFRYQFSLDAMVFLSDGQNVPAQILNVSRGGLSMRLLDRAHLHGPMTILFDIHRPNRTRIQAKAVASWSTERLHGVKFVSMCDESREAYDDWLNYMELA